MTRLPSQGRTPGVGDGRAATTPIHGLRRRIPGSFRQFVKFAIVGGSGTLVNLLVFTLLIHFWGVFAAERPLAWEQVASGIAFCVAVVNNFTLNRCWTFRHKGPVVQRFGRFFTVSLLGLGLNVLVFTGLRKIGVEPHLSQLLAILIVTPFNFLGSKLWAFR